jgi:hypothetical protein
MALPGIVIKVGVDAANAVKNLDNVGKALNRTASRADKARLAWKKTAAGIAAGAAVFATAVAAGVDAAMDEQVSLGQLNNTLGNLGFAAAADEVQTFIDNLQYTANVADDKLRPAFSRLLRSTGDIAESQRALQIALDISSATGKDLDTVANGLGKAYDGNAASLGRLGLGLDKATLKSGDMAVITDLLIAKFGGAAAAKAGTLAGSVEGVKIAFDELNESWGTGILTGAGGGSENLVEVEQNLRNMQTSAESLGEVVGTMASGVVTALDTMRQVVVANVAQVVQDMNGMYDTWINIADGLNIISDAEADHERAVQAQIETDQQLAAAQDLLGYSFGGVASDAAASTGALNAHADALNRVAGAAGGAASQIVKLGDAYTAANYFGGTPTAGYDREATTLSILNSRKKLAAARAAARAKKKSDRIHAVKNAAGLADIVARAASRTGAKKATNRVQLSRQQCA